MAAAIRVLYVDDEPPLLEPGKQFLERSEDFAVTTAISAHEAIRLLLFSEIRHHHLRLPDDGDSF
jgi:DNA-binding NarL/FixJ family response regulator